jgi:GntR family transcriptional repressor for pyruvate dehydrogenase complex
VYAHPREGVKLTRVLTTERLHQQIAEDLAREILGGELGTPYLPAIPELAARYGVSSQVVREALLALGQSGLAQIQHGKRTAIAPASEWNVLHPLVADALIAAGRADELAPGAYEVRRALEALTARLAANERTESDLEAIDATIEAMANSTGDRAGLLGADSAFHVAVAVASHNLILQSVIRDLRYFMLSLWRSVDIASEHDAMLAGHRSIARAIRRRDGEAAERAMIDHLILAETIEDRQRRQAGFRRSGQDEGRP